jgi:hypothetical protein
MAKRARRGSTLEGWLSPYTVTSVPRPGPGSSGLARLIETSRLEHELAGPVADLTQLVRGTATEPRPAIEF